MKNSRKRISSSPKKTQAKKSLCILGGGFTGLTAAYYASLKGYDVTIIEKEKILGGLAQGFKSEGWDWYLERAYHHLFANDTDILTFAESIGFHDIFFTSPKTDSLYNVSSFNKKSNSLSVPTKNDKDNYRIFPVDSPQDFLRFPLLPMIHKIRGAAILALLKFSPFLGLFEKISAEKFIKKTMGSRMWEVFFEQLFRKKFGKYAGNILASFLWARITKRTKKLGYVKGGFQTFIQHIEGVLKKRNVTILTDTTVQNMKHNRVGGTLQDSFIASYESHGRILEEVYDNVISTLPSPILARVAVDLFPENYFENYKKLSYLSALVLILETDKPILDETYWLNVMAPEIPIMFIGQHTNFMDPKHYAGHHIAYIGYYLENDDPKMKMEPAELTDFLMKWVKKIQQKPFEVINSHIYKAPYAQPIFDEALAKYKPTFNTPVDNFYVANLDMTYPYDRGTNYAVKLGKEVVEGYL